MNDIQRLEKIGFKKVAYWEVSENGQVIDYKLLSVERLEEISNNILYFFAVGDVIKYIGKSTRGFKARMNGYKKPGNSQTTNIKVNQYIKNEKKKVEIYLFQDNGLLKYGEFSINLSAGLEDALIKAINPLWNDKK